MTSEHLSTAIDDLYEVFGGQPPRTAVPVCSHCVSADDVAALGEVPVRRLGGPVLGRFAEKALTTWGGAGELRAFLPRLCELAATGDAMVPITTVATKLTAARWHSWPAHERAAVQAFIEVLWSDTIRRRPPPLDLLTLVRALGTAVDVVAFLDDWNRLAGVPGPDREVLVLNLAELVERARPLVGRGRLLLPIEAWLLGPTTRIQLDRAAFDCQGRPAGVAARRAANALHPPRRRII